MAYLLHDKRHYTISQLNTVVTQIESTTNLPQFAFKPFVNIFFKFVVL